MTFALGLLAALADYSAFWRGVIGGISSGVLGVLFFAFAPEIAKSQIKPSVDQTLNSTSNPATKPVAPLPNEIGEGGKGGSGQIFGNNGTIIGGKGGHVGFGGVGRGGDGGGGLIHGDGGTIIGGDGGSVDGVNIWFPPAQSGYISLLESQGQTPEFNVQYPGSGGASGGWGERQDIVVKLRAQYFTRTGQVHKISSSKIDDVPTDVLNKMIEQAGYPWRARIDRKYWYTYFIP